MEHLLKRNVLPIVNENAKLIPVVYELDDKILSFGQGVNSNVGTGDMKTKLEAAKTCMNAGLDMIITNGEKPEALYSILDNESIGTRFVTKKGA